MAEFCKGCPNRGSCIGAIDRAHPLKIKDHPELEPAAVAIDSQGGQSKPFKPEGMTFEQIEQRLDSHDEPILENRPGIMGSIINRLRGPKRHCPALGPLVLDRSIHFEVISDQRL